MGSVFYAKRCKDTIFFYKLATKKTMKVTCSILVQLLKSALALLLFMPNVHNNEFYLDNRENSLLLFC